ncbi:MAG: hypothetical protein M1153_01985 [Patescibacteria group bacterium]|nr:hypothetical protein [Patescibacteria group bacterium]
MSKNDIQTSLDDTIKSSTLQITGDLTETAIDSLLNNSALKEIPVVRTIVNFWKAGADIKNALFLKKIIFFLNQLKDIPSEQRRKMIEKIDNSKEYRIKVSEKLLYIIDKSNDHVNSELVARLFRAFIQEKITYDEFLQTSHIIKDITPNDLRWFLKNAREDIDIEGIGELVGSGLFKVNYDPIDVKVTKEDDYDVYLETKSEYKAFVNGGGISVSISNAGKIILKFFSLG